MPFEINEPLHVYRGFVQHGARMDSKTGLHWINSEPLPPSFHPPSLFLANPELNVQIRHQLLPWLVLSNNGLYYAKHFRTSPTLFTNLWFFFFFFFSFNFSINCYLSQRINVKKNLQSTVQLNLDYTNHFYIYFTFFNS